MYCVITIPVMALKSVDARTSSSSIHVPYIHRGRAVVGFPRYRDLLTFGERRDLNAYGWFTGVWSVSNEAHSRFERRLQRHK